MWEERRRERERVRAQLALEGERGTLYRADAGNGDYFLSILWRACERCMAAQGALRRRVGGICVSDGF